MLGPTNVRGRRFAKSWRDLSSSIEKLFLGRIRLHVFKKKTRNLSVDFQSRVTNGPFNCFGLSEQAVLEVTFVREIFVPPTPLLMSLPPTSV